jgi:aryl-alcohol dehydrogenase-like predicted oxidoreductase
MGLGLAALGRPAYINVGHAADLGADTDVSALRARAHEVLDAALASGVRYFDAARSYGRAEEFLGSWLSERGLTRDDVSVGSKWGYTYTADWRLDAEVNEVKDLSIETLRRQEAETRANLGANIGLYQIHSATLDSGVLEDRAILDELARLRSEEGWLTGISVTGPRQGDTIHRALEVGAFDSVQATWNLLEPSAGPALEAAHEAGLGVIIKEAVANGRLAGRGDVPLLVQLAGSLGVTPDALALAAVLAQPWVDVVLSGASTVAMVQSNLAALDVTVPAETLERLASLAEEPEVYWEERSELPWN